MRPQRSAVERRIAFWTERENWPAAPAEYLFLGDVVGIVGNGVFGSEWTGLEPAVELKPPLPKELLASMPTTELQRGCRLLHEHDAAYRNRCPGYAVYVDAWPMPTIDEWTRAVALANQLAVQRRKDFERFIEVATRLAHAFKNGQILTATRHIAGGEMRHHDRWFWNTEAYWGRFQMCRVHSLDPFNSGAAVEGDAYIFVDRNSLSLALQPRPEPSPPPVDLAQKEYLSPYLRCMIDATREMKITANDMRKKDEIIAELPKYWPGPEEPTGEDLDRMATLIREPRHKRGKWKIKASK